MTLLNLLFFRPGGARVERLPRSTLKRLRRHAQSLTKEEDEVGRMLGLVHAPRLSIVDEESATLLRASDRERLLATGGDVERKILSDSSERMRMPRSTADAVRQKKAADPATRGARGRKPGRRPD